MGVIAKNKNQVKLFYNSNTLNGGQTHAYVQSMKQRLLAIDTAKVKITGTQWSELAEGLNIKIADLIDRSHPDFKNEYGDVNVQLDDFGWLKILSNHPQLVRRPILVKGDNTYFIETPSEINQYIAPDSAGIDKPYKKVR